MEIKDYNWTRVQGLAKGIFLSYECEIGEYKIRFYTYKYTSFSNDSIEEIFHHNIYYDIFLFKNNIEFKKEKDYDNFIEDKDYKNIRYSSFNNCYLSNVGKYTLFDIVEKLVEISKVGKCINEQKSLITSVCPECYGKKILDLGFYKRQCMKCVND